MIALHSQTCDSRRDVLPTPSRFGPHRLACFGSLPFLSASTPCAAMQRYSCRLRLYPVRHLIIYYPICFHTDLSSPYFGKSAKWPHWPSALASVRPYGGEAARLRPRRRLHIGRSSATHLPANPAMASAMTTVLKRISSSPLDSSGIWHSEIPSSGSIPNATALANARAYVPPPMDSGLAS